MPADSDGRDRVGQVVQYAAITDREPGEVHTDVAAFPTEGEGDVASNAAYRALPDGLLDELVTASVEADRLHSPESS